MTDKEREIIRNYDPPKYYKWFYKWYTRWIGSSIFSLIVIAAILMIIFNDAIFDVVRGIFFGLGGLIMWSFSSYLVKKIHLNSYLKKNGMSLSTWNTYTKGLTMDMLKKF